MNNICVDCINWNKVKDLVITKKELKFELKSKEEEYEEKNSRLKQIYNENGYY